MFALGPPLFFRSRLTFPSILRAGEAPPKKALVFSDENRKFPKVRQVLHCSSILDCPQSNEYEVL